MFEKKKYMCPCCGHYTYGEEPNGEYHICPVCFWEDDPEAYDDPDKICDCNHVSLNQAKKNYIVFGACCENLIPHVRKPYEDEKGNSEDQIGF